MKKRYLFHAENIAVSLCLVLGALALFNYAIGFRPREIKEFILQWQHIRGISLLINIASFVFLIPTAIKIQKRYSLRSCTFGLILIFAFLFFTDLFFELLLKTHSITNWIIRVEYMALVYWGFSELKTVKQLILIKIQEYKNLPINLKIIFGLILLFFFREIFHHYFTRPNHAIEDEISWWFTGAKEIMNGGLALGIKNHWYGDYTPAIPWLISFVPKLLGTHIEEFLFGYAAIPLFIILLFITEISRNIIFSLVTISLLFFTTYLSRDYMFHISALLYGECLAALLILVLSQELIYYFQSKKKPTIYQLIAIGIYIGFCRLTKPPISILVWYLTLFSTILWFWYYRKNITLKTSKAWDYVYLLVFASLPYLIWKNYLQTISKKPTYSVGLKDFLERGIDLNIPYGMIMGLFNKGTFQASYSWGLVIAILLSIILKSWKTLKLQLLVIFLYWGFVFGLYATVWNKWEYNSAGRYISHAALAAIAMLVMAFNEKYDSLKNYSAK